MAPLNVVGFVVMGLSIGWLMGLSMSPVTGGVLAAIMAAAASIVAAFTPSSSDTSAATDQKPARAPASPWSLTLLVLGVAIAAPIGVKVREAGVLGARAAKDSAIAPPPLKLVLSIDSSAQRANTSRATGAAGLRGAIAAEDCEMLLASTKESLGQVFQATGDATLRVIGRRVASREELDLIRNDICRSK